MDRIDAMRTFVTSVNTGSLAGAARKLGCSAATVTRNIALLERRLDMRLLHRNTRALRLTPFGETYLVTCGEILRMLDAAEHGAATERARPSGLLTVTAPLRFGQLHVRPILDCFLDANPDVQARLLLLDRVANLVEEGIDVAVRIARMADSAVIAAPLGDVRRVLVAAPAYLKRRGRPTTPAALREHACIMERDGAETDAWRFASATRKSHVPVAIRPRLRVNSAEAAVDSAIEGHGIARVMSYQAAAAVAAGTLVVLMKSSEPPAIPVQLVTPSGRSSTSKQREFVDFAAPLLRDRLLRAANEIARNPG